MAQVTAETVGDFLKFAALIWIQTVRNAAECFVESRTMDHHLTHDAHEFIEAAEFHADKMRRRDKGGAGRSVTIGADGLHAIAGRRLKRREFDAVGFPSRGIAGLGSGGNYKFEEQLAA